MLNMLPSDLDEKSHTTSHSYIFTMSTFQIQMLVRAHQQAQEANAPLINQEGSGVPGLSRAG